MYASLHFLKYTHCRFQAYADTNHGLLLVCEVMRFRNSWSTPKKQAKNIRLLIKSIHSTWIQWQPLFCFGLVLQLPQKIDIIVQSLLLIVEATAKQHYTKKVPFHSRWSRMTCGPLYHRAAQFRTDAPARRGLGMKTTRHREMDHLKNSWKYFLARNVADPLRPYEIRPTGQ